LKKLQQQQQQQQLPDGYLEAAFEGHQIDLSAAAGAVNGVAMPAGDLAVTPSASQ